MLLRYTDVFLVSPEGVRLALLAGANMLLSTAQTVPLLPCACCRYRACGKRVKLTVNIARKIIIVHVDLVIDFIFFFVCVCVEFTGIFSYVLAYEAPVVVQRLQILNIYYQ